MRSMAAMQSPLVNPSEAGQAYAGSPAGTYVAFDFPEQRFKLLRPAFVFRVAAVLRACYLGVRAGRLGSGGDRRAPLVLSHARLSPLLPSGSLR